MFFDIFILSLERNKTLFFRGDKMKTRKARLTEKTEFTIRYVTKELTKQTLVIEGIKDNDNFDFYDM